MTTNRDRIQQPAVVFSVLLAQELLYPGIDTLVRALGAMTEIDASMWFLAAEFLAFVLFAGVWGGGGHRSGRQTTPVPRDGVEPAPTACPEPKWAGSGSASIRPVETSLLCPRELPRVTGCGVCGTNSAFLYTCSRCSEQYCTEHIDPADHDCVTPTAEEGQPTDLWRVALGVVFFLAVIGSLGGFVWTVGSAESLVDLEDGDAGTTTTRSPPPEVQVLQAVNDARSAASVRSVGYYEPLAELAADQSWPSGGDSASPDPVAVGEVRCGSITTLVYNGSKHSDSTRSVAEAAVETWKHGDEERERLLADGWDLGGAAVVETEGGSGIRLVLCDSTGNGTTAR